MNEQRCEFEQRRLAVMRKHLANDPKLKVIRRKRKLSVFASVIGSFIVIGVAMVLLKAFVIAHEGQQGYARIVAPALQGQADGSVMHLLLRPDPVSTDMAAVIAPILPRETAPFRASVPLSVPMEPSPSEGMVADQP